MNEEDNEDDEISIAKIMKKIVEEKASQEPTLTVLQSLAKSINDKAKIKEHKVDTPEAIMKIVKQITPRTSPLKNKIKSPFKTALMKKNTPQMSPMKKRRRV